MHYTHHYHGTNREKEVQALESCRGYLGKNFDRVIEALREDLRGGDMSKHEKLRQLRIALSFIGIQGRFPVRAMFRLAMK